MIRFLEALPFTVFLILIRNMDTHLPENWRLPFLAGGGAALGIIALFLSRRLR